MEKQDMGMTKVAGAFLIATVLLPWGFSLIGADRSIVIGSGMLAIGTMAILYLIWRWTHLARRHIALRIVLTLLVVIFVGGWSWKTVSTTITPHLVKTAQAQSAPTPPPQQSSPPSTTNDTPPQLQTKNKDKKNKQQSSIHPASQQVQPQSQVSTPQDNSVHLDNGSTITQQSSGDCSPNIIGGSPTVNCPPPTSKPPRSLSKFDMDSMKDQLSTRTHLELTNIMVLQVSGNDGFQIGEQIRTTLKQSGWKVPNTVDTGIAPGSAPDITIQFHVNHAQSSNPRTPSDYGLSDDDPVTILANTLVHNHLKVRLIGSSDIPVGTVEILIGNSSQ